ncbi:hypothetical protein [Sphingobacterium multivorum]|uniref:hypothetical protein n=1 Tax=Sphingobacterium multivorum TaxID=28454 RepID=UPI0028A9F8A4|nr:hypothetical protein [Sphingobacterium multivorum]
MTEPLLFGEFTIPSLCLNFTDCQIEDQVDNMARGKQEGVNSSNNLLELTKKFILENIDDDFVVLLSNNEFFIESERHLDLLSCINNSLQLNIKMLLANALYIGQSLPISPKLNWIDKFGYSDCIIIFSSIYNDILNHPYIENSDFWNCLNELTSQKFIIHPFIGLNGNRYFENFKNSSKKLNALRELQDIFSRL